MVAIFLWALAALYVALGVWCFVAPAKTSSSLGFTLDRSGLVEYCAVYGGLEIGLGLVFAWTAWAPANHLAGLVLAAGLHAPIVICRAIALARWRPGKPILWALGTLELAVFLIAAALLWRVG